MSRRLLPAALILLLLALHAQLWFGRGSVPSVARLQARIDEQKLANAQALLANDRLGAEIRDLREGLEIVEERARMELGMVRGNEILVLVSR